MSKLPGYEEKQALRKALEILDALMSVPVPAQWIGEWDMAILSFAGDGMRETLTHHLRRIGGHPGEVETFLPLSTGVPLPTWPYRIWHAGVIALMAEKLRCGGSDEEPHP